MSALPDFSREFLDDTILLRLSIGEALCSLAEAQAMAGDLRAARRSIDAVATILDEIARFAQSQAAKATVRELEECLRSLRHRARNAETVVKLLE
jgi:hypothetical protein